jgi:hypothetical protein
LGDPESNTYALHITKEKTEITNGQFAVRMTHSEQREFEFSPDVPIDVRISPDDAANIASSLGKDGHIKAVLPADDQKSVQIEFDSGEIRILPMRTENYPDIQSVVPSGKPRFSIALSADYLIAVCQAVKAADMDGVLLEFRGSRELVVIKPDMQITDEPTVQAVVAPRRVEGVVDIAPAKQPVRNRLSDDDETQRSIPLN